MSLPSNFTGILSKAVMSPIDKESFSGDLSLEDDDPLNVKEPRGDGLGVEPFRAGSPHLDIESIRNVNRQVDAIFLELRSTKLLIMEELKRQRWIVSAFTTLGFLAVSFVSVSFIFRRSK